MKPLFTSRGGGRSQQATPRDNSGGKVPDKPSEVDAHHCTPATPYRLPRLLNDALFLPKTKDYVYKQPVSASHFLIRKDPT